jgi:hypothetical protein
MYIPFISLNINLDIYIAKIILQSLKISKGNQPSLTIDALKGYPVGN